MEAIRNIAWVFIDKPSSSLWLTNLLFCLFYRLIASSCSTLSLCSILCFSCRTRVQYYCKDSAPGSEDCEEVCYHHPDHFIDGFDQSIKSHSTILSVPLLRQLLLQLPPSLPVCLYNWCYACLDLLAIFVCFFPARRKRRSKQGRRHGKRQSNNLLECLALHIISPIYVAI